VHLAAFSVDTNPDGTVTVRIPVASMRDPAALQDALRRAGIPAIVRVGPICRNGPHGLPVLRTGRCRRTQRQLRVAVDGQNGRA
jgi:hypothetical protein